MTLVLASNSPRRRELLRLGGWDFLTVPAEIDETPMPAENPSEYVRRLADSKAQAVAARLTAEGQGGLIVAADTTVALDGEILGKPADPEEAVAMLERLRGRTHQVYTGLAVLRVGDGTGSGEICQTDVLMRSYSAAEIAAYVASCDPLDKAGAYAIQNPEFHPVEQIEGCYTNVVGLPLCTLGHLLEKAGVPEPNRLPPVCRQSFGRDGCAFA